jgi:hypothetical protein
MTITINGAAGANGVQPADIPPTGLTAEGILVYCSTRLNALDSLIQSRFAEQKAKNEALTAAGKLMAELNTMSSISEGGSGNPENHVKMGAALATQLNNTTDAQVRNKICEAYHRTTGKPLAIVNGKADPNSVTLDPAHIHAHDENQWQGFIGGVKAVQDSLTKSGEIAMIELQSVVSQRQLAIQLSTQLMAAVNEGSKSVVSNIRT